MPWSRLARIRAPATSAWAAQPLLVLHNGGAAAWCDAKCPVALPTLALIVPLTDLETVTALISRPTHRAGRRFGCTTGVPGCFLGRKAALRWRAVRIRIARAIVWVQRPDHEARCWRRWLCPRGLMVAPGKAQHHACESHPEPKGLVKGSHTITFSAEVPRRGWRPAGGHLAEEDGTPLAPRPAFWTPCSRRP